MINIINYALIALSSLTGRNLPNKTNDLFFESNYLLATQICQKLSREDNNVEILSAHDVFGITGINEFVLFEFSDGSYSLIDKTLNKEVENGALEFSPYRDVEQNFIIKSESNHYRYDYISNKFISFEDNSFLKTVNIRGDDYWDNDFVYCTSSDHPNSTFIPNKYYFDNLNSRFGNNDCDICGVIASEILLGYYDTFENDYIVDDKYDIKGDWTSLVSSFGNSPGTDIGFNVSNNLFRNVLIDEAISCNGVTPVDNGMTNFQVYRLLQEHLDNQCVSYDIFSYPTSMLYDSIAKSLIDNGNPFIAALSDHFVVVYGYDDEFYYVERGHIDEHGNDTGSIPKQYFTNFSDPFIVSISISEHQHSNNYYNESDFGLYCGCGYHHSNRLIMDPEDWGFAEQYYFYTQNAQHTQSGISFTTSRLRTGFIQNTTINLSPRRTGAGRAELKILFPKIIYELDIDLAWWSNNESQNDGEADFNYHVYGYDSESWVYHFEDFHRLHLNRSYQSLRTYKFFMPDYTDGIWFNIWNRPVGNTNKGRLSIGRIIIDYYL